MVEIEFLGPIKCDKVTLEATNLTEIKEFLSKFDKIDKKWLEICAVAVNDEIVTDLKTTLKNGDKISILPPVCGG